MMLVLVWLTEKRGAQKEIPTPLLSDKNWGRLEFKKCSKKYDIHSNIVTTIILYYSKVFVWIKYRYFYYETTQLNLMLDFQWINIYYQLVGGRSDDEDKLSIGLHSWN